MCVYSKPPGTDPDMSAPFIRKEGSTVEQFAEKVHRDFYDNMKSARIWGSGSFDGQIVSRGHILRDGDIVELRIKHKVMSSVISRMFSKLGSPQRHFA